MRARLLTVTAVAVALAVTGCGGAGSSNTGPAASSTSLSPAARDAAFQLDVVHDGLIPAGNDGAATAAVGVAQAACEVRDAGGTRNAEIRQLAANSEGSWDEAQAGEFLGYAEKWYCPKYAGKP